MLLGCSDFFPLLFCLPPTFIYLFFIFWALFWWLTVGNSSNMCVGQADWCFRTQLLTAKAWELQWSLHHSWGSTAYPSLHPLLPQFLSHLGVWELCRFKPLAPTEQSRASWLWQAMQLLDEIRPKLINQTLSMNENVIKEINCRNTCTNKNPLTYLPGIPVRKH